MKPAVSIAIETSCRQGGLALGLGEELARTIDFDASARHATQLIPRMGDLLSAAGLEPADLDELYVSAGPGSFTGLRVGITVARTLGQALPHLRCVAVPTPLAVAENLRELPWQRLGVVLDAKEECIYACLLERRDGEVAQTGEPGVMTPEEFLASCPRPLLLTGEGLGYHDMSAPGVSLAQPALRLPTAEGVWRVGRRLARAGKFTEYHHLLPVYVRKPEAVRLWEKRFGPED